MAIQSERQKARELEIDDLVKLAKSEQDPTVKAIYKVGASLIQTLTPLVTYVEQLTKKPAAKSEGGKAYAPVTAKAHRRDII